MALSMGQPSSLRGELNPGVEPGGPKFRRHQTSTKTNKSYGILLCPVITCFFMLLVFWRQYGTPLKTIIPVNIPHVHHEVDLSNPEIAGPGIELHPEDHVYREPKAQHLDWVLSSKDIRPDGVLKRVHLINGKTEPYDSNEESVLILGRPLPRTDHRGTSG